ncbi:MAG: hypothetical protein ABJF23_28945 [Bryobacteraceae bacterium]
MRTLLLTLLGVASVSAQTSAWNYVPPDTTSITAMEWRKVLDSPYREAIRQEVPPATLQLLGGINFIEGIDRVVVAGSGPSALLILSGKFDLGSLKEMAEADGGNVKTYRNTQLLVSPEVGAETQIALVNESLILIGNVEVLTAAIDHAGGPRRPVRSGAADLWLYSKSPSPEITSFEFGLTMKDGLQLEANMQTISNDYAQRLTENAHLHQLGAEQNGTSVRIGAHLDRAQLERGVGKWRESLEQLRPPEVVMAEKQEEPKGPLKVRIIGLDEGPREILLLPK